LRSIRAMPFSSSPTRSVRFPKRLMPSARQDVRALPRSFPIVPAKRRIPPLPTLQLHSMPDKSRPAHRAERRERRNITGCCESRSLWADAAVTVDCGAAREKRTAIRRPFIIINSFAPLSSILSLPLNSPTRIISAALRRLPQAKGALRYSASSPRVGNVPHQKNHPRETPARVPRPTRIISADSALTFNSDDALLASVMRCSAPSPRVGNVPHQKNHPRETPARVPRPRGFRA